MRKMRILKDFSRLEDGKSKLARNVRIGTRLRLKAGFLMRMARVSKDGLKAKTKLLQLPYFC